MTGSFRALMVATWLPLLLLGACKRPAAPAGPAPGALPSGASPVTGAPIVDIAKAMALPNAMESFPTLAHPMANKVGWFGLNNINCGLLGMPLGFLVIYVVSLLGKEPSKEMQAYVDEIRKPRGRTVLEEKH